MSIIIKSSRENRNQNLDSTIKAEIVKLYQEGISSNEIALRFGLNRTTIPKVIKRELGLESLHPFKGNQTYFKVIDTHLKAYFLGFITADGCIVDHSNTSKVDELAINIHEKDSQVLETLSRELGRETPIYKVPSKNQVALRLTSQTMCDDLKQYGLGYRKSLTLPNIFPLIPNEFHGSFTLGYFDGDGWITQHRTPYKGTGRVSPGATIGFCGTREFLHGIASAAELQQYSIRFKMGSSEGSINGIFNLEFASKSELNRMYHFMYQDCPFYLLRKHDQFLPYIENSVVVINQDQTIS